MKRIVLSTALLVACGDTTQTGVSQVNLDRPIDIAFACYGGLRITNGNTTASVTDEIQTTTMPTSACDIRSQERGTDKMPKVPPGQEDLTQQGGASVPNAFWYSLILQGGPGTVAVAKFPAQPATDFTGGEVTLKDSDLLTPFSNGISVGEEPIGIVTDASGCASITANAGSCDLSVINLNSIFSNLDTTSGQRPEVNRLEVTNASGVPIRAKPAAIVAEASSQTIGNVCPMDHTHGSGMLYVAYPSCHLVAGIDASTGKIVNGIQYDAAGVPTIVDGNVTCPDECGGGVATAGTRPVTLDLERDPREDVASRRLVIGAANSNAITVVELDTAFKPASFFQVPLENTTGDLGIDKVALSPTIGMGGARGVLFDVGAPGGQSQFVYAIASDHTVRVADVLNLRKECDTQIDPRFAAEITTIKTLSCFPNGDPTNPPRRAGARGPGIELIGDAVPISVDFIKSVEILDDMGNATGNSVDPLHLIGYFAMVSATNGATFVVNVDDDNFNDTFDTSNQVAAPMPLVMAHQLRDSVPDRGALAEVTDTSDPDHPKVLHQCDNPGPINSANVPLGGPRASSNPLRNGLAGNLALEKVTEMPALRQVRCVDENKGNAESALSEVQFAVQTPDVRYHEFPDLRALRSDEVWSITFEGSLSLDTSTSSVDGPAIRESEMTSDVAGVHLRDQTGPYCDAGVEQFDIVQLRGCDPAAGNTQCPTGYRCFVHPDSQLTGLGSCILDNEADRLASACKDYLTSLRRYTVAKSTPKELLLLPRRHELRTSPVDGCTSDQQCTDLANYALTLTSSDQPVNDKTSPDTHTWQCVADNSRPAVATGKRCEMRCDTTADCSTGTVCQGAGEAGTKTGFCMEGVAPPQACINAPQRYELRAGQAFAVVGSKSGYLHSIVAKNGECVKDTSPASRLLVGRIPLSPPACIPGADPITGQLPDGSFEPNPCSTTTTNVDVQPNYVPNTACTIDSANPTSLVDRQAPAIVFRNPGMNLTMVDPTYPGDSKTGCILDRAGGLGKIPVVFQGYQLQFRLIAGFTPLVLPVLPAFPVKVMRGPTNSIWVIDEGDFLSTSIAVPSTRGKVFRLEPRSFNIISLLD